jgi:hypothetical protein
MIRAIMHRVIAYSLVPLLILGCTTETRRPVANASNCQNGTWGCGSQQPVNNGAYSTPYGTNQPNYATPQQGNTGYPSNTPPTNNSNYPAQPTYAQTSTAPTTTAIATALNPPPFAGYDPISTGDVQYLANRTTSVVGELINNLDSTTQSRVRNIPIVFDSNLAEVNAYASCAESGKAAVTVTNGLELVAAHLAEAQAVDEIFGTRNVDNYIAYVAKNQRSGQTVLAPVAGSYTPAQLADSRKQSREQQVFDEMVAFVVGHELGHHYLNHLPCTSILPLDAAEIGQVVTSAVPMFNQPYESAADVAGVTNVLRTGAQRNGYHFTENGALLTMRFFSGLDQSSPADIFSFERTHPPPSVREPIIRTTAQTFRATAGVRLPWMN